MAPCTELAFVTLAPGAKIEDESVEAGQLWSDTRKTLLSRDGYLRSYWGRKLEDENELIWLIDWESIEHHRAWIMSDEYKPFLAHASPVMDMTRPPIIYHVVYNDQPAKPFTVGPVVEIVNFFFPPDLSETDSEKVESLSRRCIDIFMNAEGGPNAMDGGWVVEGESMDNPVKPGEKGKPMNFVLAWNSVDHHQQFRNTEAFAEGLAEVRAMAVGIWVGHVKLVLNE